LIIESENRFNQAGGLIEMNLNLFSPGFVTRVILLVVMSIASFDTFSGGPSLDAVRRFEELMGVKWLACNFDLVKLDSGEVIEAIGFDENKDRIRVLVSPMDETEFAEAFVDDKSPFAKTMVIVFNESKTRFQLVYPSIMLPDDSSSPTTMFRVQEVAWLTPGSFQLTFAIDIDGSKAILNMTVIPRKNMAGDYQALATTSFLGVLILMSAQCSDEVEDDLHPELEKIRNKLQGDAAVYGND
jgi:hypothetical protein